MSEAVNGRHAQPAAVGPYCPDHGNAYLAHELTDGGLRAYCAYCGRRNLVTPQPFAVADGGRSSDTLDGELKKLIELRQAINEEFDWMIVANREGRPIASCYVGKVRDVLEGGARWISERKIAEDRA